MGCRGLDGCGRKGEGEGVDAPETTRVEIVQNLDAGRSEQRAEQRIGPHPNSLANLKRFPPGQSGNPAGRPKGSSPRQAAMRLLAEHAGSDGEGAMATRLGRGYVEAVRTLTERMADPNASPSALASYGKALESLTRALAELDPAPKVTERRETSQRVVLSLSGKLPDAPAQLPIIPVVLHSTEQMGRCEEDAAPRTVEAERAGGGTSETGSGSHPDAPLPLRSTPPPSPPTP
jgi:hypothetical protein